MRNERRTFRKPRNHDSIFAKILSVATACLLTLLLYRASMVKLDEFTSSMKGQIVIFFLVVFVIGCFGVKWFVNKIKN